MKITNVFFNPISAFAQTNLIIELKLIVYLFSKKLGTDHLTSRGWGEGSNLPIPHLGTLHGPGSLPGWTFVQLDFDINVNKCKCCKLRTSIKKRARGQKIFMHININQ
jgi:hypothetical protein